MTPEEFEKAMSDLAHEWDLDAENRHSEMDDLMCKVLVHLGYGKGVNIFEASERWYA